MDEEKFPDDIISEESLYVRREDADTRFDLPSQRRGFVRRAMIEEAEEQEKKP